jgi:type VII secretion integral membrane protein EccD
VSLVYGGVGGLLLGANVPLSQVGASNVLLSGTVIVVFSAIATIGVGAARPVFLSASIAAAALALGAIASMSFGASAAASAAIIGTLAFATIPMMPMMAYRFAGMRVPSIPTGPDDVRTDKETVNGADVLARSDRAAEFLTGMLATAAITVGGAMVVVALVGALPGAILCTVLALCLMLRARPLLGRAQRLTVLIPGAAGLGLAAATAFVAVDPLIRLIGVLGGLAVIAVTSMVYGFSVAGKRISPVWPRTLDILEVVLIVSVVPLALWVSGLFGVIGSLA